MRVLSQKQYLMITIIRGHFIKKLIEPAAFIHDHSVDGILLGVMVFEQETPDVIH